MTQEGMSAALLTSLTETWRFSDDLMCEHKVEKGIRVAVWVELLSFFLNTKAFIWAPSDYSLKSWTSWSFRSTLASRAP